MNQLNLLWQLQNYDKKLDDLNKELLEIEKGENIEDVIVRIKQIEYDITDCKTQIDVDNAKIKRKNRKVDEYNYRITENNKKLYSGEIVDIDQLNFMSMENKKLINEVEELESKMLDLMENVEKLNVKMIDLQKKYNMLNKQFEDYMKEKDKKTVKIKDQIKETTNLKQNVLENMDKNLIEKYEHLMKKKGKAVVKVLEKKCNGCHMNIPLSLLSKLKSNSSINYCDNCGRILYYSEE